MQDALSFIPAVAVDEVLAQKIQNGMKVSPADFPVRPQVSDQGVFKVVDTGGRLIAVLGESPAMDSYNYCCVFST
jgi:hypothetical protein